MANTTKLTWENGEAKATRGNIEVGVRSRCAAAGFVMDLRTRSGVTRLFAESASISPNDQGIRLFKSSVMVSMVSSDLGRLAVEAWKRYCYEMVNRDE